VIEQGQTADVDAIADLWVQLAADQLDHGSHLKPAANRQRIRDSLLRHAIAGTLIVAQQDDTVLGFATCSVESGGYEQDIRRGVIENLYVVPERRDKGLGAQLLKRAESVLDERDCDMASLEVMANNQAARRFYDRQGYTPHRVELEREL
jgi:ribosomal protein S18 acetylase RimI-like enzyme